MPIDKKACTITAENNIGISRIMSLHRAEWISIGSAISAYFLLGLQNAIQVKKEERSREKDMRNTKMVALARIDQLADAAKSMRACFINPDMVDWRHVENVITDHRAGFDSLRMESLSGHEIATLLKIRTEATKLIAISGDTRTIWFKNGYQPNLSVENIIKSIGSLKAEFESGREDQKAEPNV